MKGRPLSPQAIADLRQRLAARNIGLSFLHPWCWRRGIALPPFVLAPLLPMVSAYFLILLSLHLLGNWLQLHLPAPYNMNYMPGLWQFAVAGQIKFTRAKSWSWILWLGLALMNFWTQFSLSQSNMLIGRANPFYAITPKTVLIEAAVALFIAGCWYIQGRRKGLDWRDAWRQAELVEAF
jgi:hypothetical protein